MGSTENSKSRVYGEKVNINTDGTKSFWNGRATKYSESDPFVSVIFGDNNPERAKNWDEFEKTNIMPLLGVNNKDVVLDIGCGVGRLSDEIIPRCKFYIGTDFAEELIEIAKERAASLDGKYEFAAMSFQDVHDNNAQLTELLKSAGAVNLVIINGVMQYINDDDISSTLRNMAPLLADSCRFYIGNTIGLSRKLTLNDFYSEELDADYSSIYRTEEEYLSLFSALEEQSFSLADKGDIEADTANNKETKRIYHIYSR